MLAGEKNRDIWDHTIMAQIIWYQVKYKSTTLIKINLG